ncbi:hypothetical protein [Dyella sp. A6]|uniref:hypothetical protein n=1 Tax=Dyella aluminiiresistens TaxID=3069105 RepID=UPI002E78A894|nr:hypothetical protein [Dyella sp. A6]
MQPQAHIYCPHCRWEPRVDSRWLCTASEPGAGCGTRWNTFWTAGCCPGCGHYWTRTQCLACKQSSPHEAWYHYPSNDTPGYARSRELETTGSQDG